MSDKKVLIQGEEIDYGDMTDEEVEALFINIKEKELESYKKILEAKLIINQPKKGKKGE